MEKRLLQITEPVAQNLNLGYGPCNDEFASSYLVEVTVKDKEKKMEIVKVYLKQGAVIIAQYELEAYEEIYDTFINGGKLLNFSNCCIVVSEVSAIQWEEIKE